MCELTQPNPEYPDETQLTETPETLHAISDLFGRMETRARQLYDALNELQDHNTFYRSNPYSYDRFKFEDNSIVLEGSYYDRCDGNQTNEIYVSFEDFYDPEYLDRKRASAAAKKAQADAEKLREEAAQKAKQEAAEREQYARLQAKFGG